MKALTNSMLAVTALLVSACSAAFAEDVDVASLYEVTTKGTSEKVKLGEKGKVVIEITTKPGAYISEEAPLKIELSSTNVKPEKDKLGLKDSIGKKAEGAKHATPRFEVPISAQTAGKTTVDAKMSFFVCTEKICSRQKKNLSLPIEVQ